MPALDIDSGRAQLLFVAVTLFLLAATIGVAGRRRRTSFLLAGFLGLVGLNFFAIALQTPGDIVATQIAFVAVALDPLFLLLFVTAYPYPRRTRGALILIALVAVVALMSEANVVSRPRATVGVDPFNAGVSWEHALIATELVVAYTAAWLLALGSALKAPTPILARRSAWLLGALGVAVVPRLGYLQEDYRFSLGALVAPDRERFYSTWSHIIDGGLYLLIVAILLGVALMLVRRRQGQAEPDLRQALKLVGVVTLALGIAGPLFRIWASLGGPTFGFNFAFSLRWILFAGLLLHGILSYEVLTLQDVRNRIVPILGALVGAAAGFLFTIAFANSQGLQAATAIPLGLSVALGGSIPCGFLARVAARSFRSTEVLEDSDARKLELYRAALEAAWAQGPPREPARARLERDRRAFGVSIDEARALEHVVATGLREPRPGLQPGEEPLEGIVVRRLLGESANSRVYEGARVSSGQRVVVKEILLDRQHPEATRRKLLRESRALQSLSHPNLARLIDFGFVGGRYLLVLEYLDGQTLANLGKRGKWPEREAFELVDQVLQALGHAHSRGVVHRDVNPSNILVANDGRVRLTDFGIALVEPHVPGLQSTITSLELPGGVAGTLSYMAPEQGQGEPATPAADLYAAGLVLYELLAGRPALDLRGCSVFEALRRVTQPRVNLQVVPPRWRPLVEKALSLQPTGRFRSAQEFRTALLAQAGSPVGRVRPGTPGRSSRP